MHTTVLVLEIFEKKKKILGNVPSLLNKVAISGIHVKKSQFSSMVSS